MARTVSARFTDIESAIEEAVYCRFCNPSAVHNYGVIVKYGKFEVRRVRADRPYEFLWTTESLIPRCHIYTSGAHTIFVDLNKKDITVAKGETN